MDRKVIERLLCIERELNMRKDGGALQEYMPHAKQVEFHNCTKKNRWVFGGNRSGKTECGAVEAVRLALSGCDGWVVSHTFQVQRSVAQRKILKYLPAHSVKNIVMYKGRSDSADSGIIDTIVIRNSRGGESQIGFKSCEQGREKFQGASLDFVWFDEEPPEDIYDECAMRVLDRGGKIFATMTPLKGETWVHDRIYMNNGCDPEVWHIHMSWEDNPYLPKGTVERLTDSMDKDALESRKYGRFSVHKGLVFNSFTTSKHVIQEFDVPHDWKSGISIDPGLRNPLACLFFAVDFDGNVYVVGEHYQAGLGVAEHSEKIDAMGTYLKWPRDERGRLRAFIDSAANQITLAYNKSVLELFHAEGKLLLNPKVEKDIFSGISKIKKRFDQNRLFIFDCCVNLIKELKTYRWGSGDVPIKHNDHAIDALRYYLMSRVTAPKKNRSPSEIESDKKMLIKRVRSGKGGGH